MELTLKGLKNGDDWKSAGIKLPEYDIERLRENTCESPQWLHFGAGNIFRIFIGGIADKLIETGEMNSGIVCVETFDFDVIDNIYKPYDNLVLAVTLNADGSTDKEVFASLTEGIKSDNIKRLKEIFVNKSLQIVSFTITEKGYVLRDTEDNFLPFIKADIENGPDNAKSAVAVLCALLNDRYKANKAPVAIVSMDNCSHNGEKLMSSVVTMAEEWLKKGYVDKEFIDYITDESLVAFPWSMIDKITPRPSEAVADTLQEMGVKNMDITVTSKNTYIAPFVNAEKPQYLVIEDKFPNGRPPLERAGVYMTDRDTVNKVERMKVTTCLNPLHTALAVYGCVLGYTLIADEMRDKELKKLVEIIGLKEGMEVVTDPGILSPKEFVNEVLNVRMPNPFMPDAPQRIATDTSQKVGIRYGETIKAYVEKYGSADRLMGIPLAIAGWFRYLLGVDDDGNEFELSPDPMLAELTEQLKGIEVGKAESYTGQLRTILSNDNIFGIDLYKAGVGDNIEKMFREMIEGRGAVRKTLEKYTGI